ncbi:SsgA family sporulation/cell division regulator [Streptomyces sp. NBC_00102]|uniref:SsgA family sporulation/cell division regulator n=1 Tax=Streptomyces sp. NBC_00102 TaxID=2975652 RepID=UPI002250C606|nr:SsgA family sporulation/cell division regulator [Streptomyces sp. NBC_00102]MCX5397318.1 SsgA family sporulation/cell division regulator [Streptomyces sp. NBC_00102]
MRNVVERELELKLVLSPERSIPVPARLTYRADDPYAVHIVFHVGSQSPVHWTFARELLMEGVFRPCGHGDVRIWPTKVGRRDVICVALSSPDGNALLEVPSASVSAWLERTLTVVPPGTESEGPWGELVDRELAELLSPLPADDLWLADPFGPDDAPQDGNEA